MLLMNIQLAEIDALAEYRRISHQKVNTGTTPVITSARISSIINARQCTMIRGNGMRDLYETRSVE